jgi:hypothetical protein
MSNIDFSQVITADEIEAARQDNLRAAVTAEAQRRIVEGVTINGLPIRGTPADLVNLLALADTARDMVGGGKSTPLIPFRDADNVVHTLTPQEMLDLANAAKQYVSEIYAASWALKDAETVPEDYADGKYWP